MPEPMATDDQRWQITDLFAHFGIKEMEQVRADAARILKLDYLPDLREMTAADADDLLGELRRALAAEAVSDQ
jgi:bacterioferritin (cytochrome b1)